MQSISLPLNFKPTSDCEDPYTGYVIGWGFTGNASQHHHDRVLKKAGNQNAIKKYNCNQIGSPETSCAYESLYCITVSTWNCCASVISN